RRELDQSQGRVADRQRSPRAIRRAGFFVGRSAPLGGPGARTAAGGAIALPRALAVVARHPADASRPLRTGRNPHLHHAILAHATIDVDGKAAFVEHLAVADRQAIAIAP